MTVFHIENNGKGFEEVELIANRVSNSNHLSVIEKDGQHYMTGGFIVEINFITRQIFCEFSPELHYKVAQSMKVEPFVKAYYE